MRDFAEKIELQRKVLAAVNARLPVKKQLPGLTAQAIAAWQTAHGQQLKPEVVAAVVRASELTASVNDFSAPAEVDLGNVQEELREICRELREADLHEQLAREARS